jgi:hypothetical protein
MGMGDGAKERYFIAINMLLCQVMMYNYIWCFWSTVHVLKSIV